MRMNERGNRVYLHFNIVSVKLLLLQSCRRKQNNSSSLCISYSFWMITLHYTNVIKTLNKLKHCMSFWVHLKNSTTLLLRCEWVDSNEVLSGITHPPNRSVTPHRCWFYPSSFSLHCVFGYLFTLNVVSYNGNKSKFTSSIVYYHSTISVDEFVTYIFYERGVWVLFAKNMMKFWGEKISTRRKYPHFDVKSLCRWSATAIASFKKRRMKSRNLFEGNIFKPIWVNNFLLIPNWEKRTFKALTLFRGLEINVRGYVLVAFEPPQKRLMEWNEKHSRSFVDIWVHRRGWDVKI